MNKNNEPPAIEFIDVSYRYPRSSRWVVTHLDLKIHKGEFVAIMGENGASKSTICQMMNGIIPNSIGGRLVGQVLTHGLDTKESGIAVLATKVGIVLEDPETQLFTTTVRSEVAFGPENLNLEPDEIEERIRWALDIVRLSGFEERMPSSLSGGQKQRLAIAANIAMRPDILVLDEATSQLDPVGVEEVLSVVRELNQKYGMTIIMATDASEMIAKLMDRVIVLNQGQLEADGTPHQIFSNKTLFQKLMIRSPQVSQLASQMETANHPFASFPITVDEAKKGISELLGTTNGSSNDEESINRPKRDHKQVAIQVENLDYIYQPLNVHAVKGISFNIYQGEFVAVIGQNGSGKTTVLKNLLGLLRPTSGTVMVCGQDTKTTAVAEMARHVGFVLQNPDQQLFADTVSEEVAFGPKNLGLEKSAIAERVATALELVGLEDKGEEFPPALAKGDRAKVVIASALALDPEVVILDEPTTGQDYRGCHQIMQIAQSLHDQGRTVVFVTHHMALVAEYAQRVIVLSGGKVLLDDVTEAVFSKPEVVRQAHIIPPQITELGQSLPIDYNLPRTPLTVDAMYQAIMNRFPDKAGAVSG
ncbi:MAG: ATP-binding cassette domain-containing protein [Anaerolineae bacterium]|nr:ATP-binding cassette domain-containing protein [Anaerolineae bacterium]